MKITPLTPLLGCAIALVALAACAPTPGPQETPAVIPSPTAPVTPTATPATTPSAPETLTLKLWVPPQFDPASQSEAGALLQARLDEFSALNPGTRIEVRVKAASGSGGLLASLTSAHAAAPQALPDLIALPRADLETAAIKGLLSPLDGLTAALEAEDWYAYARQLASVQEDHFGLPFAGDALVLIYRPSQVTQPPRNLEEALALEYPLTFPAASPEAQFPLLLYMASGGRLQDSEGRPTLEASRLTSVLTFFQEAERAGVLPFWLTQYETYQVALQAYRENSAQLAITWASTYLADPPIDTVATTIPTPDGSPFTLADGWVWALSTPHAERRAAAARLAEFLSEGEFLGAWSAAAGYLPTRAAALPAWPPSPLQSLVGQVVLAAQIIPSTEVLTVIGPALQEATIEVLKQQMDPPAAAKLAVGRVSGP